MFRKILIANRGEIAVRIIQTCREMGIATVALYQEADQSSLHVRLSDECVPLTSAAGFMDQAEILRIAAEKGADAIHPGIGFLAENPEFVRACEAAGIAFIGASSAVVERVSNKLDALERVRAAGLPTVTTSAESYGAADVDAVRGEAERLGYPIVLKSCSGGRGPGARLVHTPEQLETALRRVRTEAQLVYGVERFYLEKALLPAHQIGVQVIADRYGHQVHLEEREGSLLRNGQKVIEESPSPCLNPDQRAVLWALALKIATLFGHENVGTIEFLVDDHRQPYFAEIKPRLQVEHPLTEMRARIDLVREQFASPPESRSASSRAIFAPRAAPSCAASMLRIRSANCRVPALRCGCRSARKCESIPTSPDRGWVPPDYNPLFAKVTVWAAEREACLARMLRALQEFWLPGGRTNLPLLCEMLEAPNVRAGDYFARAPEPTPLDDASCAIWRWWRRSCTAGATGRWSTAPCRIG
ncbi:MAG: biotin carboxylase N-terminal domain-containing protein [Anaerolineae bacterium]